MATAVYTKSQTAPIEVPLEVLNDSSHIMLEGWKTPVSQRGSKIEDPLSSQLQQLSRTRAAILITTLTGITFVGSMSSGLLTVCLPGIAIDLNLPDNLLLW